MTKQLFVVKNREGKVVASGMPDPATVKNVPYANKQEAKIARDALGGIKKGFYVSRGRDHIGPHGHGKVPMMRRQPASNWKEV